MYPCCVVSICPFFFQVYPWSYVISLTSGTIGIPGLDYSGIKYNYDTKYTNDTKVEINNNFKDIFTHTYL